LASKKERWSSRFPSQITEQQKTPQFFTRTATSEAHKGRRKKRILIILSYFFLAAKRILFRWLGRSLNFLLLSIVDGAKQQG